MTDVPPSVPAPVEPVPPAPQTAVPAVPGSRRRSLRIPLLIGGGVLVALLAAAGIAYAVVASQRTPDAAVTAFLDELVAGDAAGAQKLLTSIPAGNPVLLQPDTYAATADRITGFTVVDSRNDGRFATVTVTLEQAGESYTEDLTLALVRKDLGLFDVWRVQPEVLPNVYVSYARPDGMELDVNGTDFGSISSYEVNTPAFPGTYTFEPVGATDSYSAEPVTITVRFAGPDASTTAALEVTLTEAGTAAAQAAVDAQLDACLAQPVFAPQTNCGFSITQDAGTTYMNVRWTLLTRPTVTFGVYRPNEGWAVVPESPGSMRLDADFETSTHYGTAAGSIDNFHQAGYITSFDENGVATFESIVYE